MRMLAVVVALMVFSPELLAVQETGSPDDIRTFISVDEPVIALTHVQLIDGTGADPKHEQTIVIERGRITAVGPTGRVHVPDGAQVIELRGHTVIPGMVGLHDHLFYFAPGGRQARLTFSGPRLYLGSGVTTIRTTGSLSPYADINLKSAVDDGEIPGPRIHITAPYLTGAGASGMGDMARVSTSEEARRFVAYWAEEGATWIKVYTDIRRSELKATIDEAHARGMKVTGHLCSVTYQEAVALGIDNLEHGLLAATDFDPEKTPDTCPPNSMTRVASSVDVSGEEVQKTIRAMVESDVSMTSTLSVFEPFIPNRPTKDQRTLDAMAPEVREAYLQVRERIDGAGENFPFQEPMLKKSMEFERAFARAGGLLAAGVDPTGIGGALPGFGDQRNYELLVEAGFSAVEAVQIVSANGAKILGLYDELGSVEPGKLADLAVLEGDLTSDPAVIRNVTTVFKGGVGYDSEKLITSVRGQVGIR